VLAPLDVPGSPATHSTNLERAGAEPNPAIGVEIRGRSGRSRHSGSGKIAEGRLQGERPPCCASGGIDRGDPIGDHLTPAPPAPVGRGLSSGAIVAFTPPEHPNRGAVVELAPAPSAEGSQWLPFRRVPRTPARFPVHALLSVSSIRHRKARGRRRESNNVIALCADRSGKIRAFPRRALPVSGPHLSATEGCLRQRRSRRFWWAARRHRPTAAPAPPSTAAG